MPRPTPGTTDDKDAPVHLEPFLLEVLACPACRSGVRPDDEASELVCTGCGLAYPVRDDIPVMLVDEARQTGATR